MSYRLYQLTELAEKTLQRNRPPLEQNSLAAYLSSGLSRGYITLDVAIEATVEKDSLGPGREEAMEAVEHGILNATSISNASIRNILESTNEYISMTALNALANKLSSASIETMRLFVFKILKSEYEHEIGIKKALFKSLSQNKAKYQNPSMGYATIKALLTRLEENLNSCYLREKLELLSPEQIPDFNVKEYTGLNDTSSFSYREFKELRELKKLTRKQLLPFIAEYKPTTEKTVLTWETGQAPLPNYAIKALLDATP